MGGFKILRLRDLEAAHPGSPSGLARSNSQCRYTV
jgi:hypothetical protein